MVSGAIQLFQSSYTNGVVVMARSPVRSEVESATASGSDSVEGQALPELGDLVMPMDESWFSQDFYFDEGLIEWQ